MAFTATPTDMTVQEARSASLPSTIPADYVRRRSARVPFDAVRSSTVTIAPNVTIDRDVLDCFRVNRYGK